MSDAKQSEWLEQYTFKHAPVSIKFHRRINVGTLIDFDKVKIQVAVEHEIETIKLKKAVLERVLLHLKDENKLKRKST